MAESRPIFVQGDFTRPLQPIPSRQIRWDQFCKQLKLMKPEFPVHNLKEWLVIAEQLSGKQERDQESVIEILIGTFDLDQQLQLQSLQSQLGDRLLREAATLPRSETGPSGLPGVPANRHPGRGRGRAANIITRGLLKGHRLRGNLF